MKIEKQQEFISAGKEREREREMARFSYIQDEI